MSLALFLLSMVLLLRFRVHSAALIVAAGALGWRLQIFSVEARGNRVVVLLMGVSGAGKTTVGTLLASQLGWEFADADDYHSAANVEKMRNGIPLTDADRVPWLESLRELIAGWIATGENGVLACSALKKEYRDRLAIEGEVRVVYLKAGRALLRQRL